MTANALKGAREECLAAGMDDYLSKPMRLEALDAALRRWTSADGAQPDRTALATPAAVSDAAVPDTAIDRAVLAGLRALQQPGQPDLVDTLIGLFLQKSTQPLVAEAGGRRPLTVA
jgi:CheY-like chemotaxis protein